MNATSGDYKGISSDRRVVSQVVGGEVREPVLKDRLRSRSGQSHRCIYYGACAPSGTWIGLPMVASHLGAGTA